MKINITNMYGMAGESVAQLAQNQVADIAKSLGANEFDFYCYPYNDEPEEQRNSRMDGIISSIGWNDVFILQSPTWNGFEHEEALFYKAKAYGNKTIIFVQDVIPLMFTANLEWLPVYINFYNQADLLILPSKNMYDFLVTKGLTNTNIVYQNLWDHLTTFTPKKPKFERSLTFTGDPDRFPFTKQWNYDIPLKLYTYNFNQADFTNANVDYQGYYNDILLMNYMNSGFGLCWSVDTDEKLERTYSHLNVSYKLSTYLAAGIPIIANDDISCADIIRNNNLGFLAHTLDEAISFVKNVSEDEYNAMSENVKNIGFLIRNGYITRRVLTEAVEKVLVKV